MTLARPDDLDLLAAWMERDWSGDEWDAVGRALTSRTVAEAVARARLLGLPAAVCEPPGSAPPPFGCIAGAPGRPSRSRPLVVDLSSLWAGPLCTRILAAAGARVVKVESTRRPDGARSGTAVFFDLMHAGKESVALDFTTDQGRAALRALVAGADVVVESSRPRALEQLGIAAGSHPGIWIGITGYGRARPGRDWVAFGDDAAVAGGITALTGEPGGPPLFCADAYADPVTGLFAAVAALACSGARRGVAGRHRHARCGRASPRRRGTSGRRSVGGTAAEPPPMPVPRRAPRRRWASTPGRCSGSSGSGPSRSPPRAQSRFERTGAERDAPRRPDPTRARWSRACARP